MGSRRRAAKEGVWCIPYGGERGLDGVSFTASSMEQY